MTGNTGEQAEVTYTLSLGERASRATYNFLDEARDQGEVVVVGGAVLGVIGGATLGYNATDQGQHDRDKVTVKHLGQENHAIDSLSASPSAIGNSTVQAFLKNQEAANTKKIATIKKTTPEAMSDLEAMGYMGGGAIVGIVALSTLLVGAKRLSSRVRNRDSGNEPEIS